MDTPLTNISGSWTIIQRTIKTDYWMKPDWNRNFDWEAWFDGEEERGSGHGATRDEAIADLLGQLEEEVN